MANIFISSTYKDLKDYRERASLVIRKMGHNDIAMEYYGAEDKRPLDKCLEDVAACDLYIGIFAWRYGYIPHGHEKSITELEYRKARECNKPCQIFLLKDDASWPMNLVEKESLTRIESLRKELSDTHIPAYFSSIDEFGGCVSESIYKNIPSSVTTRNNQELFVEQYYNAILKRYKILDLDALTPPEKADFMEIQLRSVFVEQDVRENPPPIEIPKELLDKLIKDEKIEKEDLPEGITLEDIKKAKEAYFEKPALSVLDVITNPMNRNVVILGDPGSGKSTLSRYLLLSLITKEDEKLQKTFNDYLPLLIELRDYAFECTNKSCNTFIKYLDLLGETKGYGLTKGALDNYLKNNGKAILIFDGLDEIFDPNQRENVEKQIVGFTNDYPKAWVLVTSRIVGYKRSTFTNADFSTYTLQDFRKPQIDAFIDKWYSIALINNPDEARDRKERINRSLDEPSIRQLAGNPLLLTIMAIINKHQELPRERWRLYDHASSVLIHHWDWERRIKEWNIKIEYVSKDDKEELLRRIAYKMQSAPKGLAGNYIHKDTLQTEFEKYFKERYQKNPADAKLAARVLIDQLRERNFVLCRYGSNLYGFIHRTFLEYFCSCSFVWKFNIKHEFDIEDMKSIFNEHWGDKSWHEVLRLICGMIDEKFAEILICYLMREPPPDESNIQKIVKLYPELFYDVSYRNFLHFSEVDRFRNERFYYDISEVEFNFGWTAGRLSLAIKCLGELKNIEIIRDTSSELLEKTWELLVGEIPFYGRGNEDIITSIKSVGKRWVGREILKDWIPLYATSVQHNLENNYEFSRFYYGDTNQIGVFIGSVGAGDNDIRESVYFLLKKDDIILKNIALTALAFGWYDESDTLKLLQNYALKDANEFVRERAISLIGHGWQGDINNLKMLQNCALNDKAYSVRNSAIQVIAGWSNNSNTLPFLCDLAKSASDFEIRKSAVQQIGKARKKDIIALELLKDRAANDTYSGVREIAVSVLGEQWKNDPIVLSMLCERAYKEQNPAIRENIFKILATKDA